MSIKDNIVLLEGVRNLFIKKHALELAKIDKEIKELQAKCEHQYTAHKDPFDDNPTCTICGYSNENI
jgi:hypothetical protein